MNKLRGVVIKGIGSYVPQKVLSNHDLEQMVDTSDEWITERTGIKNRHIANENETTSSMGINAAREALKMAEISPEDLDLIITCTVTPDMYFPATSCLVQRELGATHAGTMDIEAACSGLIYGLSTARQFLATGEYNNILVIASETLSRIVNWEDRNTCVLFGDGASAMVLSGSDVENKIFSTFLGGDGNYADLLYLPAGGSKKPATLETVQNKEHTIVMNGKEIFKIAINKMKDALFNALEKAKLVINDLDYIIPHQANIRIINMIKNTLKLPEEKVFCNIDEHGNTSAASIGIALVDGYKKGIFKKGDKIGLTAFGGGLTWASAIFEL